MSRASFQARRDRQLATFAMMIVVTMILHNFLETNFFRGYSVLWVAFLIAIAVATPRFARRHDALPEAPGAPAPANPGQAQPAGGRDRRPIAAFR